MRALVLCCALAAATLSSQGTARGNPSEVRDPPVAELSALLELYDRAGAAADMPKKLGEMAAKQRAGAPADQTSARQRWQRTLDRRIGKPATPMVNIYNTWTREFLPLDPGGKAEALDASTANGFLRCHFTNQPAAMDPRLVTTLVAAARHFKVARVDIVSGFRSPKYNLILQKKGREVARNSQHTVGSAVDFRLPGVSVKRVHAWAKRMRLGGVGFYPSSGFVHVDTGPVRYWTGR
jgi:uncharacterized protein YcbK (DUF882 family)